MAEHWNPPRPGLRELIAEAEERGRQEVVAAVKAAAVELEAEFMAYRHEGPVHLALRRAVAKFGAGQ